jgi:hypothetical protein
MFTDPARFGNFLNAFFCSCCTVLYSILNVQRWLCWW